MSDSEDEEYLNCYSTFNTKNMFKKQIGMLKTSKNQVTNPPPEPMLPPICAETSETESNVDTVPAVSKVEDVAPNETTNTPSTETEKVRDNDTVPGLVELPADTARSRIILDSDEITVLDSPDIPNKACSISNLFEEDSSRGRSRQTENEPLDIIFIDDDFDEPTHCRRSKRTKKNRQLSIPEITLLMKSPKSNKGNQAKKKKAGDGNIQEVSLDDSFQESPEDDINYESNVKIVWKSTNIVKIPVRRLQKLEVVFEHFMKEENVGLEKIMLTFNGKNVKPTDTPEKLNLNVTDFLEGGVVSTQVTYQSSQTDESKFSIKFQDCSKKTVTLGVKYEDKMKTVLLGYAEQIEKPLTSFTFMFDGSVIDFNDTPESLGMENGDVVDVMVKNL